MDLRSIINTDGDSAKQAAPVTPVQAHPAQGFRDFSHPPQASPGKHPSQDYGAPPSAGGSYAPHASPLQYQQRSFQGRPPQPPPIQPPPQPDLRSPHRSYSVQSPYQRTPSSTSSQYPFPQSHQTPQSPAQHAQYPPPPQRDSYPPPNAPQHLQHHNSFPQNPPTPQTPPVGIPGAPHPFLQHQRSVSSISNSTPTSATPTSGQSQQQHYFQYQQQQHESPVSAGHYPPSQLPQHQRQPSQQSQPGTPLGPPLTQRPSAGSYPQPSSPFQQRGVSAGPFSQAAYTSPRPQAPPSLQRLPSTPSGYDSQRTSTSEPQRRSQSERERSVSVSPKTRLPSQPRGDVPSPQSERDYHNSQKRKMDDREAAAEAPRRIESIESQPPVNGAHLIPTTQLQQLQQAQQARPPPKKRMRYTEPPIWAQSVRSKVGISRMNGKQALSVQPVQAPPPTTRPETNGNQLVSRATPQAAGGKPHPSAILGPWEESILGMRPTEQMTKLVADFLFLKVVSRGDLGELASRGVEIEIEAKLGQLIEKDTNERLRLPVTSECILAENSRVGFRSSMTETQHQKLNDFLNAKVQETFPRDTAATKKRVPVNHIHLREVDSFYELPQSMHGIIPPALREQLNPRHGVKVRVTHNQKKDAEDIVKVKAKIIKARIADLDIYNPQTPLDCRISINFEMKFDGDVSELGPRSGPDRKKDRLSYTQSLYQIDLTQVTQLATVNGANQNTKEHELEIELQTSAVREQGQRAMRSEPNEYIPLIEGFIDNMRVLSRATPVA